MKILLIGGGRQIGFYLLKNLLKNNNNEIFLFNKGSKNYSNFKISKHFKGDRNLDFKIIDELSFDCIIDTCCYSLDYSSDSLKYFSSKTSKYIMISSSYVNILKNKEYLFNKSLDKKVKKTINDYAINKYKCENFIQDLYSNYCIIRSVPLISLYDHTKRTLNFIKYIMNNKNYSSISNKNIQVNSANQFSNQIVENINDTKNSVLEYSGSIVSALKIIDFLNLKNLNYKNMKNDVLIPPFMEFNTFFPGKKTHEKHILKVFKDVYLENNL